MASSSEDLHAALVLINNAEPTMFEGIPMELSFSVNRKIIQIWAIDPEDECLDEESTGNTTFDAWINSVERHTRCAIAKAKYSYGFIAQNLQKLQDRMESPRLKLFFEWKKKHPELTTSWKKLQKNVLKDRDDAIGVFSRDTGYESKRIRQDLYIYETFQSPELRPSLIVAAFNLNAFLNHRTSEQIDDTLLRHLRIQRIAQQVKFLMGGFCPREVGKILSPSRPFFGRR